jgi:predicted nucleotidyltransferase
MASKAPDALHAEPLALVDLERELEAIGELCRRYGVARLDVFGSVAENKATRDSDIDFLVEFTPEGRARAFHNFFGLKDALVHLLNRRIDLVSRRAMRNPIMIAEVERTRKPIYVVAR